MKPAIFHPDVVFPAPFTSSTRAVAHVTFINTHTGAKVAQDAGKRCSPTSSSWPKAFPHSDFLKDAWEQKGERMSRLGNRQKAECEGSCGT